MSLSTFITRTLARSIPLLLALALATMLGACSTDSTVNNADGIITDDPDGDLTPGDEGTDPTVSVINFLAATETNLVLKGIAGADQSIVTFTLRGDSSNPVVGVTVNFTLSNSVGGVNLGSDSAVSDDSGNVTVVVNSGTAPTIVKVTATTGTGTDTVSVDSDDISISTGAAIPSAFSIAATIRNPRGLNYNGTLVVFTARASDQAGNPVPNGTLINFRTEGGQIESSCSTTSGACDVDWFSADPRPLDGRATIFAHMGGAENFTDYNGNFLFDPGIDLGGPCLLEPYIDDNLPNNEYDAPESFVDSNGNGKYDLCEEFDDLNEDGIYDIGESFEDSNSNGMYDLGEPFTDIAGNGQYDSGEVFSDWNDSGVHDSADLGEPFADYNENNSFDAGIDQFVDFNNNGVRDAAGDGAWTEQVAIGKTLVIVMSGDGAYVAGNTITAPNSSEGSAALGGMLTYSTEEVDTLSAIVQDVNGNSLPTGTNIAWASTVGTAVNAGPSNVFGDQTGPTVARVDFNAGTQIRGGELRLKVTVPGVVEQEFVWLLDIQAAPVTP